MTPKQASEALVSLRNLGYRVTVSHARRIILPSGRIDVLTSWRIREIPLHNQVLHLPNGSRVAVPAILPTGGNTRVLVELDEIVVAEGESHVRNDDLFLRQRGFAIALGRAVKQLPSIAQHAALSPAHLS